MNQHSFLARVYHMVGLFSKAADEVSQLATLKNLKPEDEATISVVTKSRIDSLRKSRRIIQVVEEREDTKGKVERVKALRAFKAHIEQQMEAFLKQFISNIDEVFLKCATSDPSKILFLKMKADFSRYLAEIDRIDNIEVQKAYSKAYDAAKSLTQTHPLRTGIALNYSVFYYEILKNREEALNIAQTAYDEAINTFKNLPAEEKDDAIEVINLINENIKNWKSG